METDEITDITGKIKLFVPTRIINKICKEKGITADSKEGKISELARKLNTDEIRELFEECKLRRFLSIRCYVPRKELQINEEEIKKKLKKNNLIYLLNETGGEKESFEIRKNNKPDNPLDLNIIEIRISKHELEVYFEYTIRREYLDYHTKGIKEYNPLRGAKAVLDIKKNLLLIFTRNEEDAYKIMVRIKNILEIEFDYCFFSESQMENWETWAKNLRSSQLRTNTYSQISGIRLSTHKTDGDLRKDEEYQLLKSEAQKNGIYLLFEHNGDELGVGINKFGKIYFRNHVTISELDFILRKTFEIISDYGGLPILSENTQINPKDYLDKILPFLTETRELKKQDFDDKFTSSHFIASLECLSAKGLVESSYEYICSKCGECINISEKVCVGCNEKFEDLKELPFQKIYFINGTKIKSINSGTQIWISVSPDKKIFIETPTYKISDFDIFEGIFDNRYRNINKIMKQVRDIKEDDGLRGKYDLTKIFSKIFGVDEQKHSGMEVADIPLSSGIKYKGKEITYIGIIKSAVSGRISGKKGDNLIAQVVNGITKSNPEVIFVISTAQILPNVISNIKLLCGKLKKNFIYVDIRAVTYILLKYGIICYDCGSIIKDGKCGGCKKEYNNSS